MHVVVNHLHLRDPMPPEIVDKAQDAVRSVVDAGGRAAVQARARIPATLPLPVLWMAVSAIGGL